jgi:hypothetical protein
MASRAAREHRGQRGAREYGGWGVAEPASAFEAVTRIQLDALRDEVAEIKGRVNGLLWVMVAAVVVDLVKDVVR